MSTRVQLVHGYVQLVAEEVQVDVLHIKGPALHASLTRHDRTSTDTDVLVRPQHVAVLVAALQARGWRTVTGFREGSAFGHAMNLSHDMGAIDLHRWWPGFGAPPEDVFEHLWAERSAQFIAGVPCYVPSLAAQRVLLISHFARSGIGWESDLERSWTVLDEQERTQVRALVSLFESEVSFAAATGELEELRSEPEYQLWRYFSRGSTSRFEEWYGRWNAARGPVAKASVAAGFLRMNRQILRAELGHEPSRKELRAARWRRLQTAGASLAQFIRVRGSA